MEVNLQVVILIRSTANAVGLNSKQLIACRQCTKNGAMVFYIQSEMPPEVRPYVPSDVFALNDGPLCRACFTERFGDSMLIPNLGR